MTTVERSGLDHDNADSAPPAQVTPVTSVTAMPSSEAGVAEPPASAADPSIAMRHPRRFATPRTFDALAIRDFRLIFFGNLSQFGAMQMKQLALGVLVFQFTGSFAALGVMALSHAIPGLLIGPVGGVVADRAPKKTVIQVAQGLNMLNALAIVALAVAGILRFEHLILSGVAQGAVNAVMMPSRQSLIPDLVGPQRTMNAVALNTSGENLMQLAGPAVGGLLLAFFSPAYVFGVIAGMFAFAMAVTGRLPAHPPHAFVSQQAQTHGRSGSLRQLREGLAYTWRDRTIRTIIWVNFIIILATFPYMMMLPGFVREVLDKGPAEQGMLMSVTGVGALVGSLIVASLPSRKRGRWLLASAMALAVSLIAFAWSTNYYVTLVIMLFVGVMFAMRRAIGQVLIQSYPDPEYRGRVMSIWIMQFSLMSLGTFATGLLAEWLGPQLAIGGLAAALLVILVPVALFVRPIRDLE